MGKAEKTTDCASEDPAGSGGGRLKTRRPGTGTAITRPTEDRLRLLVPPKTVCWPEAEVVPAKSDHLEWKAAQK